MVIAATLLVGCSTTEFVGDAPKACSADFTGWGGGLTTNILQGDGSGTFDFDPPGDVESRTHGEYNLENGDFWWVTEYASDDYRTRLFWDGYGTAWTDGDLDIVAEVEILYANDEVNLTRVYERRLGCDVDRRVVTADENEDLIEVESGIFSDGQYDYERTYREDDLTLTVNGNWFDDQYRLEELDSYQNGTYRLSYTEQSDSSGLVRRDFVERWTGAGSRTDGFWELPTTGVRNYNYTVSGEFSDRKFKYEVDLDGNGDGTVKIAGETCDVKVKKHKCTYTCDDSDQQQCD